MDNQAEEISQDDKVRRTHHRSPAYPILNLEIAIGKAKRIYDADKRSFTSRAVILKHLGYKDEASGKGNRELAALKQFGLLEEKADQFRVSAIGYSILFLSEGSQDRKARISEAALNPVAFRDIWEKYGSDASDEILSDYLIHNKRYNPASVNDVVLNYRATITFAKLTKKEHPKEDDGSSNDQDEEESEIPKIGDLVQWEAQGVLQFKEPRRVRGISDDSAWVFVDGSETGVPVDELSITSSTESRQPAVSQQPPRLPLPLEIATRQFSWPLSKGVTAEVKLTGNDITAAHLELLRSYLELAKQAMAMEEGGN